MNHDVDVKQRHGLGASLSKKSALVLLTHPSAMLLGNGIEADMIAGRGWTLGGRAFPPQLEQREPARSLSLEASGPLG